MGNEAEDHCGEGGEGQALGGLRLPSKIEVMHDVLLQECVDLAHVLLGEETQEGLVLGVGVLHYVRR